MTYDLSFINGTVNPSVAASGISAALPELFPFLLFFEFMVIALMGGYGNKRLVGTASPLMWMSIAGLVTSTSAVILLATNPGVITLWTAVITVAITFLIVGFFLMTKNSGEE